MSYQHIIAARQRLQAMGVPHLAIGGPIGGPIVSPPFHNPIPGWFGAGNTPASGGAPQNPVNAITPQDGFQATQPGITQTNFQPGMQQAMGDYGYGQGALHNSVDRQNWSGDQQVGVAGQIGGDAANVSGLAQGPNGLGGVLSQQQSLGQALAAQAAGQGPNPAQEQYKQNLQGAIAQNAGFIASQKGVDPAIAARMASQNAAQMEGQAAGNAATLQAQQQLAAQQQQGQVLQQQGQTVQGQGNLYATSGQLHNAQAGVYGGAGQTFQGAGNTAAQATGQANQLYGTNVAGQGNQNNAINTGSLGTQGINAGVANTNTLAKSGVTGGLLNAGGGLLASGISSYNQPQGASLYAEGGSVPDQSASVLSRILALADAPPTMPSSGSSAGGSGSSGMGLLGNAAGGALGGWLGGADSVASADALAGTGADAGAMLGPLGEAGVVLAARGGRIPGPQTPDARAMNLAQALMAQGGPVPGHAQVAGNSLKNDVVPAVLSPGEVVLPRSVTQSPDAAQKAAAFVESLRAKAHPGYGKVLEARRKLAEAHAAYCQGGAA